MEVVAILECNNCGEEYIPEVQGPGECEPCLRRQEAMRAVCALRSCRERFDPDDDEAAGRYCSGYCHDTHREQMREDAADMKFSEWKDSRR